MKEEKMNLSSFYDCFLEELKCCGGKVEARFFGKMISKWKSYNDGASVVGLRFDLVKGTILKIDDDEIGLALGWGSDDQCDPRYLRLQFGGQPAMKRDFRDVRELQDLVVGGLFGSKTGEFYDDGIKVRPNYCVDKGFGDRVEFGCLDNDSAQIIVHRVIQH